MLLRSQPGGQPQFSLVHRNSRQVLSYQLLALGQVALLMVDEAKCAQLVAIVGLQHPRIGSFHQPRKLAQQPRPLNMRREWDETDVAGAMRQRRAKCWLMSAHYWSGESTSK